MQLIVADTGPINYLILIGNIDVLPKLSQRVIVPAVVRDELHHPKATHGLINSAESFDRIKRTSFHYQQDVIDKFLADPIRFES